MKLLKPIIRLSGMAALVVSAHANSGLDEYRLGQYDKAAATLWSEAGKNKSIDYSLGRMQLNGYGILKNDQEGLAHLAASAKKGSRSAQWFMGRYELTVKQNPEKAYYWFNKLAEKDDLQGQLYVIAARQYGYGVRKEPSRAQKYYIDAAKKGNAIAQYVLGKEFLKSRHSRSRKLGLIWLKKSAEQEYPRAQYFLGNIYLNGKHAGRDKARAIDFWAKAAENGYVPAMLALGKLAFKQKEYRVAKSWFEKGAKAHSPSSMLALSELYLDKDAPFYDSKSAFIWTLKAADMHYAKAQEALAKMYKEGQGVRVDLKRAKQWEVQADKTAQQNKKTAAESKLLALVSNGKATSLQQTPYYLHGILTNWTNKNSMLQGQYNASPKMRSIQPSEIFKPDFSITMPESVKFSEYYNLLAPMLSANGKSEWRFPRYPLDDHIQRLMTNETLVVPHFKWRSMIEPGSPYPQAPLEKWDYLASQTMGAQQRANLYAVVMRLYNQAILGNPDAQFEIGQLYHYGVGLAKSPEQAKIYYELAADQDDVRAEYNLGILYMEGQFNTANYEKGMSWLTDAAFRGNAYAQYALANIYQYGVSDPMGMEVVAADPQRALSMYYLSSSNHFGPAQYKLANYIIAQPSGTLSVAARNNRHNVVEKLYQRAALQGVADAYLPYAFYQAMDSNPAKQENAFSIAEKEANKGTPQAALLLGLMYDRGISVKQDKVKALYWYQKADPSPVKSFVLGTYYTQGQGLEKNMQKGRELLQQAANAGLSYADLNLAVLNKQTGQPFMFDLLKAKSEGNISASLLLADYYLAQDSDEGKLMQARDIYQALAAKGEANAQLKLGYLYVEGKGGPVDLKTAAYWFTKASKQGQPMAQFLLAQMYQRGQIGAGPNLKAAKKWYSASKNTFPRSALALGFIYDTSDDLYRQAADNYRLAAANDQPVALYNLGLIYEYGKGRTVNENKARDYYTKAAQKHQVQAMTRLAVMDFKGLGGNKNDAEAWKWFSKAAQAGDREALYHLGLLYETGIGHKIDFAQAVNYYQKASVLGDQQASLALARIYQYGLGGFKKPERAKEIYVSLATQNNALAQYQLALMAMQNTVDRNGLQSVKKLLTKAVDNGSVPAKQLLNKISVLSSDNTLSFIHPISMNRAPTVMGQQAEHLYWGALYEWNRGDAELSRMMLERLLEQYPQYTPAKRAYEQLNQSVKTPSFG